MPNPCYYHPSISAIGTCIQCGTPGCTDCLETIGDKMACRRCGPALKSKLPAAPVPPPQERPLGPNPYAVPSAAQGPRNYMAAIPVETLTPDKIIKGIVLALVVGTLGAIGVEKVMLYSHHGFAFLYVFLGFMVSASLRAFTGRGGQTMALVATITILVCLGISHVVYAQDLMTQARAAGDLGQGVTLVDVFPVAMSNLKVVHWMFVLASVVTCMITANQEAKKGF